MPYAAVEVSGVRRSARIACALLALAAAACGDASHGADGTSDAGDRGFADARSPILEMPGSDAMPEAGVDAAQTADARTDARADAAASDAGRDGAPPVDARPPECANDDDCDDHVFCNGNERCSEGRCFPSPAGPCDDHVSCTLDACDEERDACTYVPDSSLCPPGQTCDRKSGCFAAHGCRTDEDCDDALPCNGVEVCVESRCRPGEPVLCDDGVFCTQDTCLEETGQCQNVPLHTLCPPTEWCSAEMDCIPRPPCRQDDDCEDPSFCNGLESCDEIEGRCAPGAEPPRDDAVECTIDQCSEARAMVVHLPSRARCSDGQFCDGTELCHPLDGCQPGTPPVLSDGIACTTDTCDEEADYIVHAPVDAVCDDGLFCNGHEVCHPLDGCGAGEPPPVNDGVGCTVDACSEVDHRVSHVPTDALCDDHLFCNGAETCDAIEGCRMGAAPQVADEVDCTDDSCDEAIDRVVHLPLDARCDDHLYCDGVETCDPTRGCLSGRVPAADDGVACTEDLCDEATHAVVHVPTHGRCDDGRFCNGLERCDAERGCLPGSPPVVDDGIPCTDDGCDEEADRVTHTTMDIRCDDHLFCDGAERCDAERGCLSSAPPLVDDGIACTDDTCDEAADRVVHAPVDARCDDRAFCDGQERCDPASGCVAGRPPVVDDLIGCTDDACDEDADRVVHTPVDARCDNDQRCDGEERCDAVRGCQPGRGTPVDDGIACTVDTCDEQTGAVSHVATDARCDDGRFCNGAERCDADRGCLPGEAPLVDDGIACTADACDEAADRVTHVAFDARCDDGAFCDGAERCDAERGCLPGDPPPIDDGFACTDDRCDEAGDRVVHAALDGRCDDGAFCDGLETCDPTKGCVPGTPPVIDDGVDCTDDGCDEAADRVVHQPVDVACDDDLYCDGTERCDPVRGCVSDRPAALDDGVACTVDQCDEAGDTISHTPDHLRCDDDDNCNGLEVCDAARGCVAGQPLADGSFCGANPRSICLATHCRPSTCGDGYRDAQANEDCDDGNRDDTDACSNACHVQQPAPIVYPGTYDFMPRIDYTCADSGWFGPLVDLHTSQVIFAVVGNELQVTGIRYDLLGRSRVMRQTPAPNDGTFNVRDTYTGDCDETYVLAGRFTSANTWTATLTISFAPEVSGGCLDCQRQVYPLTGTRR